MVVHLHLSVSNIVMTLSGKCQARGALKVGRSLSINERMFVYYMTFYLYTRCLKLLYDILIAHWNVYCTVKITAIFMLLQTHVRRARRLTIRTAESFGTSGPHETSLLPDRLANWDKGWYLPRYNPNLQFTIYYSDNIYRNVKAERFNTFHDDATKLSAPLTERKFIWKIYRI